MASPELAAAVPWGPVGWAVAGGVLLVAGRKLFWLVLAAAGFAAGLLFALELLEGQAPWLALGLALVTGLLAAGLAVLLPKVAAVAAGFLAGGWAGLWVAGELAAAPSLAPWLAFAAAGVVAALLALWLLDWALIAVSSLLGAALVLQAIELEPTPALLALLGLAALGMAVQLRGRRGR